MKRLMLTLALAAGWTVAAQGAPLDSKQVSADAKWLVHVDFDGLRASQGAEHAREHWMQHEAVKKGIAKIEEEIGLNPTEDLHGFTLYGTSFEPGKGVAIIQASADKEKLMAHLKAKPDYTATKDGDAELHSWTEKHRDREHRVFAAFSQGRGVFASTDGEVKTALAVLSGASPGLGSDSPLARSSSPGAIFQARATGMAAAKLPIRSKALQKSSELSLAIGENEGESFLEGRLVTDSAETAQQVKGFVEGIRSMGELRYGDDPDSLKIVEALKVETGDKVVEVVWRAPAEEVLKMAEKERAKAAERWKDRERPRGDDADRVPSKDGSSAEEASKDAAGAEK